jgi:hypothetical protein
MSLYDKGSKSGFNGPHIPIPFPSHAALRNTSAGWQRNLWTPGAFEYDVFEDSFFGNALAVTYPNAVTSSGTVVHTEHNAGGFLEIKSGASNTNYAGQGLGKQFTGDRGFLAEFAVEMPNTITSWKWECGMTDEDDDAGGAVLLKATPTFTADDCALFVFDTTDDANIAFVSSNDTTDTATQDIQPLVASDSNDSSVYIFAIRGFKDSVSGFINGKRVSSGDHVIDGSSPLTPWVFSEALSGSQRILKLLKWRVIAPAY